MTHASWKRMSRRLTGLYVFVSVSAKSNAHQPIAPRYVMACVKLWLLSCSKSQQATLAKTGRMQLVKLKAKRRNFNQSFYFFDKSTRIPYKQQVRRYVLNNCVDRGQIMTYERRTSRNGMGSSKGKQLICIVLENIKVLKQYARYFSTVLMPDVVVSLDPITDALCYFLLKQCTKR